MEISNELKTRIFELDKKFDELSKTLETVVEDSAHFQMISTKKQMCSSIKKEDK